MNTGTTVALFAVSSLSLIVSASTLTVVLVGARKMKSEVEEVKNKTSKNLLKFKTALENLDI